MAQPPHWALNFNLYVQSLNKNLLLAKFFDVLVDYCVKHYTILLLT